MENPRSVSARRFGVGHAEIRERGSSSEARRTSTTPALIELSRSLYQEMERAAPSHHHALTRFPDESFHVDCNIRINFEEMEVSIFSFFYIDLESIDTGNCFITNNERRDGIKG